MKDRGERGGKRGMDGDRMEKIMRGKERKENCKRREESRRKKEKIMKEESA